MHLRKYKRFLIGFVIAIVLIFVVTEFSIVYDGLRDDIFPADAALILGSKVNVDGTLSDRLRGRLDAGLLLHENGLVQKIVVSGGLGKEGHYEGDAMAAYLVKHEVPKESIIIDNDGNNTYLTARNFIEAAESRDIESVIVVSQFFHISRTRLVLRKLGFDNVGSIHSTHYEWRDAYGSIREFAAYYKYLLAY
jgi:vancomycin permeability regulator SanA